MEETLVFEKQAVVTTQKPTPNDIELTCNIITSFYMHKPNTKLSAKQMHAFLSPHFNVSEERVKSTMDTMVSQALLGHGKFTVPVEKEYYEWSIRQNENGGLYCHYSCSVSTDFE